MIQVSIALEAFLVITPVITEDAMLKKERTDPTTKKLIFESPYIVFM